MTGGTTTTPPGGGSAHHPPLNEVRRVVAVALAEDLVPMGDLTSALLDPSATASAAFRSRESGRLAGRLCAEETFGQVDGNS